MGRVCLTILSIIVLLHLARCQDMLGLANSNYAGVHGIGLNPAGMNFSKLYMDYNFIALNAALDNNYMYWERNDFLVEFLYNKRLPIYITEKGEVRNYKIYKNNAFKYGFQGIRIAGPAGMVNYGKHAFGITTASRIQSSFFNLSPDVAFFLYEALDCGDQYDISYSHFKPIQASNMSWFEVGLSYAYNFKRYPWESLSVGITIKPLFGNSAVYANINEIDYVVLSSDTAIINNVSFDYAYSLPLDYDKNTYLGPLVKGFGFGVDLGIVYEKTKRGNGNRYFRKLCEQDYDDYYYRLGFSLLDIGYIKFNNNAGYRSYGNANAVWIKQNDTIAISSVNDMNKKIDYYFGQSATSVEKDDKFIINTPPAASVQFDYHLRKGFYINGTLIYGFKFQKVYLKRPTVLALIPRFESRRLEISIPLSLYEWEWDNPRIGLAIRWGGLYVGSDKINNFIGLSDFTGYDFYFGLRLNLSDLLHMNFIKGQCGNVNMRNIEMFDIRNF